MWRSTRKECVPKPGFKLQKLRYRMCLQNFRYLCTDGTRFDCTHIIKINKTKTRRWKKPAFCLDDSLQFCIGKCFWKFNSHNYLDLIIYSFLVNFMCHHLLYIFHGSYNLKCIYKCNRVIIILPNPVLRISRFSCVKIHDTMLTHGDNFEVILFYQLCSSIGGSRGQGEHAPLSLVPKKKAIHELMGYL